MDTRHNRNVQMYVHKILVMWRHLRAIKARILGTLKLNYDDVHFEHEFRFDLVYKFQEIPKLCQIF